MLGKELNIRPYPHASHLKHRPHSLRDPTLLSTQKNTENPTTWHPQLGCEHEECQQIFHTGFGTVTFEELYKKTQRIVGGTLRQRFGMENPEDIDDCMQAGYLKVWQQLQKNPSLFADKPKNYVVQAVVFHSKAQRYAHLRHYHKLVYDADASKAQHSATSQPANVDTWIDLSTAIQRVAEHTTQIDNPLYTLALYSLITQVKTNDVIELFGNGLSTIHKVRRRLKATLAQELPEYGQFTDKGARPLTLPRIRSFQLAQLNKKPISDHFFTDTPTYAEYIKTNSFYDESMQSSPVIHTEHLEVHQQPLESEQLYTTTWRGQCTLEEILNDTRVRRVAYSKMQSLGNFDEDADDCFQIGSIRLWKTLQQCPDLLIGKSAGWLGVWIAHSGSRRELWKHRVRKAQFDNPEFDLETADERLELSPRNRKEQWANFATHADERIDFELLMSTLAQQYDGDPLKLFALYSLTTSVNMKSVLPVVHAHKNQMIQARRAVKEDMQTLIEAQSDRDVSEEFWTHDTTSEAALVAIQRVAERVLDNERLLLALYIVTTSAKRKDVTKLFGIGITWFRREVILVKALLAEEMRKYKTGTTAQLAVPSR